MMIRALVLAFLALASAPASHAAEPAFAPLVLAQSSAPATDPHHLLPREQALMQRHAFYETTTAVVVAGSAGAVAAVLIGGGLVTALIVGGAVGVVIFASGI